MDIMNIEGIGIKTKELLEKLDIYSFKDLIEHYPYRYEIIKRSNMQEIKNNDKVIIDGRIEGQPTTIYLSPKYKKIILRINTGNNIINITIYNQLHLMSYLKMGNYITVIGKYDRIRNTIIASDIRLDKLPDNPIIEGIYSTTNGLSRKAIAKYIQQALEMDYEYKEMIPNYIIEKYNLLSYREAIKQIHKPMDIYLLKKARQRVKYEELFWYLLRVNYLKEINKNNHLYLKKNIDFLEIEKFINNLKYKLTEDQINSINEIIDDMNDCKQMNRLLQGDVGSGKTIVAFVGIYANYLAGYQSALMVPTEILAKQHYEEAIKLFKKYKMNVALLTSSVKKKDKLIILDNLKNGNIDLVIGTHSLLSDNVIFNNLGLVICDEQHRFGVNQRNTFKNKGINPDILSMSATPIPRTYALTLYCDMDVSSIKTKPVGRLDVITYFKKEKEIIEVLELMQKELLKKHQVYVIAPAIESDNELDSVILLEENMKKAFGKKYKIGMIHGKMDVNEKNKIMEEYELGNINILVSTTVIEVGVNVPNATMIVIFNADMFGLSTLHQLRGRVGRSDIQSYCVLIAKENNERLKFLEGCSDGFLISEYDFNNRGGGTLYGIRQSGDADLNLKIANFKKDSVMLMKAKDDVLEFIPKLFEYKEEYIDIFDELNKINNYSEVKYGE